MLREILKRSQLLLDEVIEMHRECPGRFEIWIGGYICNYILDVKLVDTTLEFGPQLARQRISPTAESWEEFWIQLNAIGVWKWTHDYRNHDILDGIQWSIDIQWDDKECKTHGSNSYPLEDGSSSNDVKMTPAFERLIKATKRLTGEFDME